MNVNLSPNARAVVEQQVAKGRYRTADEYLDALVLRDRNELRTLDVLLREGFESGPPVRVNVDDIRKMGKGIPQRPNTS